VARERKLEGRGAQQIQITVDGRKVVLLSTEDDSSTLEELTAGERSVALLAAEGLSNADIAERRGCSVRTVANQLASVYKKIGVSSREQLVSRLSGESHGA
jgi:DNA-binding CsgD family transcriptional regulator